MDKKKVKELMIPLSDYPHLYEDDNLEKATNVLREYRKKGTEHRSLMVFNHKEELTGLLTTRVILNAIKSHQLNYKSLELFNLSWARFYTHDEPAKLEEKELKYTMRPVKMAFVQWNDSVSHAIDLMVEKNINLVPVFENNKVIGVLRSIDLLDYFLN